MFFPNTFFSQWCGGCSAPHRLPVLISPHLQRFLFRPLNFSGSKIPEKESEMSSNSSVLDIQNNFLLGSTELPLISSTVSVSPSQLCLCFSRPREKVSKHRERGRSCAGPGGGGSSQQQQREQGKWQFAVSGQWRPPLSTPLLLLLLSSSPGGEKRADGPPGDRLQLQIIWDFSRFLAGLSRGASIPRSSSSSPSNPASPEPPVPILCCLPVSWARQTAAQPLRLDKRYLSPFDLNTWQLQDPTVDPLICLSCPTRNLTSTEPRDPIRLQLTLEREAASPGKAVLLSQASDQDLPLCPNWDPSINLKVFESKETLWREVKKQKKKKWLLQDWDERGTNCKVCVRKIN